MGSGDVSGALAQLSLCREHPCWATVESLWTECRDRLVYQEREHAGQLLLEARSSSDSADRGSKLTRAREILVSLNEKYPNSRHHDGIQQSIQLVDDALGELNPGQ